MSGAVRSHPFDPAFQRRPQRGSWWSFASLLTIFVALFCGLVPVRPAQARTQATTGLFDREDSRQLDRAVRDLCRRQVVLLGEDANHGAGRTLEIKIELVKRLVERCGFGAVVFESSLYESLAYARALAGGNADEDRLLDAAGQLWFWASEARPFAAWLHAQARTGRVRVGGMDIQPIGVNMRDTRAHLGAQLSAMLDPERAAACRAVFDRHHGWRYGDADPFDDTEQTRLRDCVQAVHAALEARGAGASPESVAIVRSYRRYLGMALDGDAAQREIGMFENLQWHRAHWPKGTRVIVWCATVHAAKRLEGLAPDLKPFGAYVHEADGDRAAAIGFTAMRGSYGLPGGTAAPRAMAPAGADALETRVLGADGPALRYLDRKRLSAYGTIAARPINYRTVHAAPWADVFDGMIVLREEKPIVRVEE